VFTNILKYFPIVYASANYVRRKVICCRTTLRKLEVRVLAYLEENTNENVTCIDFFNTLSI